METYSYIKSYWIVKQETSQSVKKCFQDFGLLNLLHFDGTHLMKYEHKQNMSVYLEKIWMCSMNTGRTYTMTETTAVSFTNGFVLY